MIFKRIVITLAILFLPYSIFACDICGCFVPHDSSAKGFQVGFAEQYSSLSNLYLEGEKVSNPEDQYMNSSYSQVLVNYRFNTSSALQLNVPLIYRAFQRAEGGGIQKGTESGIGDMLLLGTYTPFQRKNPYSQFRWKLLGGLKFPTGNSDRIGEELSEEPTDENAQQTASGVHGHDLALGSGSWDGLIGSEISGASGKWYYTANIQYAIRTRGDFDYKYANDLVWYGGPGYFLATRPNYSVGLSARIAGEYKGEDELGDQKTDDTAVTSWYLGPSAMIGIRRMVMADIGLGFPLSVKNSGLQTVPKYRMRIGLTWQFQ